MIKLEGVITPTSKNVYKSDRKTHLGKIYPTADYDDVPKEECVYKTICGQLLRSWEVGDVAAYKVSDHPTLITCKNCLKKINSTVTTLKRIEKIYQDIKINCQFRLPSTDKFMNGGCSIGKKGECSIGECPRILH